MKDRLNKFIDILCLYCVVMGILCSVFLLVVIATTQGMPLVARLFFIINISCLGVLLVAMLIWWVKEMKE